MCQYYGQWHGYSEPEYYGYLGPRSDFPYSYFDDDGYENDDYNDDDCDNDDYIKDKEDDEVQGIMNMDIEKEMYPLSEDKLIAVKSNIPSPDLDCISLYGKTSPQPDTWGIKMKSHLFLRNWQKWPWLWRHHKHMVHWKWRIWKICQIYTYLGVPLLNSLQFRPKDKNEDSADSKAQLCKSGKTAPEEKWRIMSNHFVQ